MNQGIETEIRACENRLYAAMLASDLTELDALIADDLLFAGPTGELATKEMDLELHRTGGTQFNEFTPKDLQIRVWSEQFALASAKIFLSGTYLGQAFIVTHGFGVTAHVAGKLLAVALQQWNKPTLLIGTLW
jgi:hypothetical protein